VGRAKGIVDEQVGQRGQLSGKVGIVGLFLGVKAGVLQQENITRLAGLNGGLHLRPDTVVQLGDRAAQQLGQATADGVHLEILDDLAFGAAQMGTQDHGRLSVQEVLDGGQRGPDAGVVGHLSLSEGDVEINAHQHPLPLHIHIADGFLVHVVTPVIAGRAPMRGGTATGMKRWDGWAIRPTQAVSETASPLSESFCPALPLPAGP